MKPFFVVLRTLACLARRAAISTLSGSAVTKPPLVRVRMYPRGLEGKNCLVKTPQWPYIEGEKRGRELLLYIGGQMGVWVSSEVLGRDRKGGGMVNCYRLVGNG